MKSWIRQLLRCAALHLRAFSLSLRVYMGWFGCACACLAQATYARSSERTCPTTSNGSLSVHSDIPIPHLPLFRSLHMRQTFTQLVGLLRRVQLASEARHNREIVHDLQIENVEPLERRAAGNEKSPFSFSICSRLYILTDFNSNNTSSWNEDAHTHVVQDRRLIRWMWR